MKQAIFRSIIYCLLIFSLISASIAILGLFFYVDIPSHVNNTVQTSQPQLLAIAKYWYVFVIISLVIFSAFVTLRSNFTKKGILPKTSDTLNGKKLSPVNIFIAVSLGITFLSVLFAIAKKDIVWDYLLSRTGNDAFMDFFNHITYVRDPSKVYFQSPHACFPPLAYIFYFLLATILPSDATKMYDSTATTHFGIMIYILYLVLCMIAFAFLLRALLKNLSKGKFASVLILMLASNVFLFEVFERGNSVLIVSLLLLVAMLLRDSDKAYLREIALVCIAVAVGFKIYPALFVLLYLHEKKYKETVRLIIYCAVLFFLPFIFFGGFAGLYQFVLNQLQIQDIPYVSFQSVKAAIRYISYGITKDIYALDILASVAQISFIVINILTFFSKHISKWEKIFLICSIMVFAPLWSGGYTSVFFVIPMAMFFGEHSSLSDLRGGEKAYTVAITVCFAVLFSLNMFVLPNGFALRTVNCIPMYVINIMIFCKAIFRALKRKNSIIM